MKSGSSTVEFYVYATDACNLRCSYCDGVGLRHGKNRGKAPRPPESIIASIHRFLEMDGREGFVMFYGGEPTLNIPFMTAFLDVGRNSNLRYGIHTNGTLLDRVPRSVLELIDVIFVSIDGSEAIHDKYRGAGTFGRIMRNIQSARANGFAGDFVARLTLMPDASLAESVAAIGEGFSGVFWQIENSPSPLIDGASFLARYERDLDILIARWLDVIPEGAGNRLIPFASVSYMLISGVSNSSPPCGCGNSMVYIDCDGTCYACDKLRGDPAYTLGSLEEGIQLRRRAWTRSLNPSCVSCPIGNICGGRCVPAMLKYGTAKFGFYCDLTKLLVKKLSDVQPSVLKVLSSGGLTVDSLRAGWGSLTEQIP